MAEFRKLPLLAACALAALLVSCGGDSTPKVRTYQMGERATIGHIVYVVYETQWLTHLGEGPDQHVPQNRYFLVRLSATNGAAQDVILPNFTVEDDSGRSYPELGPDQAPGVPQYIGYLHKVRPAEATQGNAVFDAAPRHYKIKLFDENGENYVYIDIPLSFTSESTEMPQVGDTTKKEQPQVLSPAK